MGLAEWDGLIRVGRAARLLGSLRARLDEASLLETVPPQARVHLDAAWAEAEFRNQMVRWERQCIERALATYDGPIVLLKGAAYLLAELPVAHGRMPSDVDFMVPRGRLDEVETLLVSAGYQSQKVDAYDQRYYREWAHELPCQ